MLKEVKYMVENCAKDLKLRKALIEGYQEIFEANFWNGKTSIRSAGMMGGHEPILKQVGLGTVGGNGTLVQKGMNDANSAAYVPANSATTRDQAEETRNAVWSVPKTKPLGPKSPEFVKKAIGTAQEHLPIDREWEIPSAQRRFAMIYPTLSVGINSALPRLN